jgi:hypothetical protein
MLGSAGWLGAAGFALCVSTAIAQTQLPPQGAVPSPTSAAPTATTAAAGVQVAARNSPVLVVDMRLEADIRKDLEVARALKPAAQADEQRASGDVIQSKATLEMKKKELDAVKTQLDAAKKANKGAEVATLERQKQKADLDIKLLERFVAVRESQVELGRARRNFADASTAALESELEMGKKRTAWDALTQTGSAPAQDVVSLQVDIRSDEGRVLQAMKQRSEKGEDVAKRESQLIQRQIDVLEADTAVQQFATRAY